MIAIPELLIVAGVLTLACSYIWIISRILAGADRTEKSVEKMTAHIGEETLEVSSLRLQPH
jgi:hypothetical protein